MKNTNLKKCFIYATVKGTANIEFNPVPILHTETNAGFIAEFDIDVTKTSMLKLSISNLSDNGSIKIDKILLNNTELNFLNSFTWLITEANQIQKHYGWIGQNGTFVIKIRQNPISQNYLNYILSLTKT